MNDCNSMTLFGDARLEHLSADFGAITRIEFDTLRLRYRAAFDAYRMHAAKVIEHSKGGERPPEFELDAGVATLDKQILSLEAYSGYCMHGI